MNTEISYDDAGTATDTETLVAYCVQGAEENNTMNDQDLDGWRDGWHLVKSYLDHNKVASRETLEEVASQLTDYLRKNLKTSTPFRASSFDADERIVLIRKEARPSERWYWCEPNEGHPAGSRDGKYCRFLTRDEAVTEAVRLGYEYEVVGK